MMDTTTSSLAEQIAHMASDFQAEWTGYTPKAVTVVLSEETVVIVLHDALTPGEKALVLTAGGAEQVQKYHRQLFESCSELLSEEIKRVTGSTVHETTMKVEPTTGAIVVAFSANRMLQVVQITLLASAVS